MRPKKPKALRRPANPNGNGIKAIQDFKTPDRAAKINGWYHDPRTDGGAVRLQTNRAGVGKWHGGSGHGANVGAVTRRNS